MTKKILIVGCGNIGFRHLSSLIQSSEKYQIYVLDNNKLIEKKLKNISKNIIFFNHINDLVKYKIEKIDLVIISTNSFERFKIFKFLTRNIKINYIILEKVVFQNMKDFQNAISITKTKKIKAWVNCPYRTYNFFKKVKKEIKNSKFKIFVDGSRWNICSNTIHYLDLLNFFSKKKIKQCTFKLDSNNYTKKNIKYLEFYGSINYYINKNWYLSLNCEKKYENLKINIRILFRNIIYTIHIYQNGKSKFYKNDKLLKQKLIYQSKLTALIAKQIFKTKKCDLIDLYESSKLHKLLFKPILKHQKYLGLKNKDICNIT